MSRLGVVITDGVGYRNFILSDFMTEASRQFDEVIIYSCLPVDIYPEFSTNIEVRPLEVYPDRFFTWLFLKLKEMGHLQLHKAGNFGIQDSIKINQKKSYTVRGWAKRMVFLCTRFLHSESWIQRFNRWQQYTFKNHPITKGYLELLKADATDLLFFTHQRPPYIAPMVYAAEQLKIPTSAFIFSWDNLASKGRMAGNFDFYFVWSNLMKDELLQFYSSVSNSQIQVVGTPQFEPYVLERYETKRVDFNKKFHLDGTLKTICFSCGDVSTSKNDPLYIETIAQAIQSGVFGKVNFIVRTSPAETPERFLYLKEKFPFIKWNYPKWGLSRQGHQETWSQRVPTVEDVIDLRAVLSYCDVFVNMCSTMSLDAMCFDKPVINPVFGNLKNGLYDDQRFLNYAHYKRVVESEAVAIVKTETELIDAIQAALVNPKLRLSAQHDLLKLQVGKPLEETSANFVKDLKACLN